MGCEEDGTNPPCPSLQPHSLLSACDAQSTRRELPERPQPELSSSSPVLTSPSSHPLPFQHQPGAEKGVRRAEGQARGKDEERGASRGGEDGRRWPGGWESLCLICFRLFKNKLRSSSGREEVGGNACAGGRGRPGRPAARKTTPHRAPGARKKAVERSPRTQRQRPRGEPPRGEAAAKRGRWGEGRTRAGMRKGSVGGHPDLCGKKKSGFQLLCWVKGAKLGVILQSWKRGARQSKFQRRAPWGCPPVPPAAPSPPHEALPALGAVCFSRDLLRQLEFIWGSLPGPAPGVTVNNSPPPQPPMRCSRMIQGAGGQASGSSSSPRPRKGPRSQNPAPRGLPGGAAPFPEGTHVLLGTLGGHQRRTGTLKTPPRGCLQLPSCARRAK